MAENKPNLGPIGPGVLIDDLPIKDKRKVPSTIVQSLEVIRIKLGGDSSYTCDSVQESIDGITNIYDDKMPSSNSILSALNKLGKVIEPGSGGSSDFSTAEVTIANTTTRDIYIYMPVQVDDEEEDFSALICNAYVTEGGTQTVTTVLYKGIVVAYLNDSGEFNVSVSGSAEYDSPNFDITGDCTITIS